jgi:uncharacterized protein (TIGR00251 family)
VTELAGFQVDEVEEGIRFRIKVQAKARREEIGGVIGAALRVRVNAPALEGRANKAVISLLAKGLQVSKGSIKITAGERSALKTVVVAGLRPAEALARLRNGDE